MIFECELCGKQIDDFGIEAEDIEDHECIMETGRCSECFEERGDTYPDR